LPLSKRESVQIFVYPKNALEMINLEYLRQHEFLNRRSAPADASACGAVYIYLLDASLQQREFLLIDGMPAAPIGAAVGISSDYGETGETTWVLVAFTADYPDNDPRVYTLMITSDGNAPSVKVFPRYYVFSSRTVLRSQYRPTSFRRFGSIEWHITLNRCVHLYFWVSAAQPVSM
jgi:hypothetical protein